MKQYCGLTEYFWDGVKLWMCVFLFWPGLDQTDNILKNGTIFWVVADTEFWGQKFV